MTDIFAYTSRGGREYNEDFVGYVHTDDGVIAVLSDGLGGVSGGDIASRVIVDAVIDYPYDCDDPAVWLSERLILADERVRRGQRELNNQMKSTVVALRLSGDRAAWAHAGDSRLYYIHDGAIAEVTADHSVAFKKYLAGQISRRDITSDEDKNRLFSSVGSSGDFVPETGGTVIRPGDAFVLCSDGAWENLLDQEIAFDYLKSETAEQWAQLLLLRIIDRIPPDGDNLSVITVIVS